MVSETALPLYRLEQAQALELLRPAIGRLVEVTLDPLGRPGPDPEVRRGRLVAAGQCWPARGIGLCVAEAGRLDAGTCLPVRYVRAVLVVDDTPVTFTCPSCGARSAHPRDVLEGYCGACHQWTGGDDAPRFTVEPTYGVEGSDLVDVVDHHGREVAIGAMTRQHRRALVAALTAAGL